MHFTGTWKDFGSYLSNPLLHGGLGDKAIDHHFLVLTDTMSSAKSLRADGDVSGESLYALGKTQNSHGPHKFFMIDSKVYQGHDTTNTAIARIKRMNINRYKKR